MTKGARVLVADDSEELQDLLKRALERAGYVVTQAFTGFDMTHAMMSDPLPDLVVLDVALPDADGRDLLSSLRKDTRTAAVPVVVWSGRDADSDRRIALDLGAEDYVEKGAPSALVPRIERILFRISQERRA